MRQAWGSRAGLLERDILNTRLIPSLCPQPLVVVRVTIHTPIPGESIMHTWSGKHVGYMLILLCGSRIGGN